MSGFVGIITRQIGPEPVATLKRMARRMTQASTDNTGTFCDPELGLFSAWSVPTALTTSTLPITNAEGNTSLLFYGEEFSLEAKNPSGYVDAYLKGGTKFLAGLNGWFSGLVADRLQKRVVLFNDRFGVGRVYYAQRGNAFYFASEAKCLLSVLPETRQINPAALAQFYSCGCVLENKTLFEGISLLPTASAWEFRDTQVSPARYFSSSEWESQEPLGEKEFGAAVEETFWRILPRYLKSSQSMGMSLTGGVDSRLVLAGSFLSPGSLPCYTFGGPYRESTDVKLARELALRCGQAHTVLKIDDVFLSDFPELAAKAVLISDGTLDVTGAVELYINKLARRIAPFRLTGNYGGEVMRQLVAFKPDRIGYELLDESFLPMLSATEGLYESLRAMHPLSFILFNQVPWHHFGRLKVEQSEVVVRTPFLDNEFVSLFYRKPKTLATGKNLSLEMIDRMRPDLVSLATDRSATTQSGAVASAARKFLQNLSFKLEYAYDYGMPKWCSPLDQMLKPLHLERLFLGHHRFYHFRLWYRDQLAGYVRDMLLDSRSLSRGYIRRRNVEQTVSDHIRGTGNATLEITKLLTLETIQRQLLEQS